MRKDLTKEEIIHALNEAKSAKGAARYLGCSYSHLRRWMKFYDSTTHSNLLEEYNNRGGRGVPRHRSMKHEPLLLEILNGDIDGGIYPIKRIKYRLCEEGYLKEKCNKCGFQERRIIDYRLPLILNFKDKNKRNFRLNNLELLCYNCFFLYVGDAYSEPDITTLESLQAVYRTTELLYQDLDPHVIQRLKEMDNSEAAAKNEYDILAYKYGKPKT